MRKPLTNYFLVPNNLITSDKFQSKEEIILFIVILRFCNWNRRAFLSTETLASLSKISRRNIFKYLKALEEREVIKIKKRKSRCSLYEVIWNYKEEISEISKVNNRHSGGAGDAPFGAKESHNKEIYLKNSLKEMSTQPPFEEKNSEEVNLKNCNPEEHDFEEVEKIQETDEEKDFEVELLTEIDDETFEKAWEKKEEEMYTLNNKDDIEEEFEQIFSEKEGKFIMVPREKPEEREIHFEKKRKLYKEITILIGNSTGMGEYHAQNAARLSGLTVDQLERLSQAIRESNFLSGRLPRKKPKLAHFSSFNQIFKILGGGYKNFDTHNYGYQQEYVPRDLKDAEPDFED